MLHRQLVNQEHIRRLLVTADADGWEVREEEDGSIVSILHRHDWHQVERDRLLFDLQARRLTITGWIEA